MGIMNVVICLFAILLSALSAVCDYGSRKEVDRERWQGMLASTNYLVMAMALLVIGVLWR